VLKFENPISNPRQSPLTGDLNMKTHTEVCL
jgi:hypothetical protein